MDLLLGRRDLTHDQSGQDYRALLAANSCRGPQMSTKQVSTEGTRNIWSHRRGHEGRCLIPNRPWHACIYPKSLTLTSLLPTVPQNGRNLTPAKSSANYAGAG